MDRYVKNTSPSYKVKKEQMYPIKIFMLSNLTAERGYSNTDAGLILTFAKKHLWMLLQF